MIIVENATISWPSEWAKPWAQLGSSNDRPFNGPVKELTTKREAKSALDSRIPSQMGVLKLWSNPS